MEKNIDIHRARRYNINNDSGGLISLPFSYTWEDKTL